MFIYRIARSNQLICGYTSDDAIVKYSSINIDLWIRQPGNIKNVANNIITDIQAYHYVVKYYMIETNTTYYINSYIIPSGRLANIIVRNNLLQNAIRNLANHATDSALDKYIHTFCIFNAVLQSYIEPFQLVKTNVKNCLSTANLIIYQEYINTYRLWNPSQ